MKLLISIFNFLVSGPGQKLLAKIFRKPSQGKDAQREKARDLTDRINRK